MGTTEAAAVVAVGAKASTFPLPLAFWLCKTSFRNRSSMACFSPKSIAGVNTGAIPTGGCDVVVGGVAAPDLTPDLAVAAANSSLLFAIFSSSSFWRAINARFWKLGSVGAFFMALGSEGIGVAGAVEDTLED